MDFYVGIASYKRPEASRTLDYLDSLGFPKERRILSVQTEEDRDAYTRSGLSERVGTFLYREASTAAGNRNTILLNVPEGTNVVFMDDDIKQVVMEDLIGCSEDYPTLIRAAKEAGADIVFVFMSWGTEFSTEPSELQYEIADNLIRSGAIDIIVIDSVAALTPKAEIEGEMGDNKVGLQARLMSQALRKLTANISKTNTCCIFINQLREKIGVMFGNPETTTGGNALKFYASVRIDVRKTTQLKDGDEALGNRTRVKVVKNKMAPPFKKAEFDIVFGEGISHAGEILDLGVEYGIVGKSGSWFSYGDQKLAQGREATKQLLKDNQELCDEIEAKVREALKNVKD